MAQAMDLKNIVKHLANGSLEENLCLVCLLPLKEGNLENIFTAFCKNEKEFCTADVLREVCHLEIADGAPYSICKDCFTSACEVYKFYLQAKQSYKIISFYTDQLLSNTKDLNVPEEDRKHLLGIPLPVYSPEPPFDFEFDGFGTSNMEYEERLDNLDMTDNFKDDDDLVVVVEDGKAVFYRLEEGELRMIESDDEVGSDASDDVVVIVNEKTRKKRGPMVYISCTHCPVKYRFLSKLKEHMKSAHDIDIFYCKICKLIMNTEEEYKHHLSTHIGEYQCTECNVVYRREESLLAHMTHEEPGEELIQNGNICEVCGVILSSEAALEQHREKHVKRYTCYYCGRLYKGQAGFEAHIAKHENSNNTDNRPQTTTKAKQIPDVGGKRSVCNVCGKSFVDERALLWHRRLHDNERPYACKECGRRFVSAPRRDQHAVCAHTPPARRCPLCPALFHLRSMVNTHLKKVHLNKQQKRRNRVTKHKNVFWRTETVPIQELSVSIQNEVLEMQSKDPDWISHLEEDIDSKKHIEEKKSTLKPHLYSIEMMYGELPHDLMGMPIPRDLESIELEKIEK